jgi:hypothetical protein
VGERRARRLLCLAPLWLAAAVACAPRPAARSPLLLPRSAAGQMVAVRPVPAGATYNYTQHVRWLDEERFVAVRLDGTISLFRVPRSPQEYGPQLVDVFRSVSGKAVEMLAVAGARTFATSNDDRSLTLWQAEPGADGRETFQSRRFAYDEAYGTANSGLFLAVAGSDYLLSGHAAGFLVIWRADFGRRELSLVRAVDVRSPHPIPSPYPLKNVRGLAPWGPGLVVSGAEDGDLCMIRIPSGEILARRRYNPAAQRGINDLAVYGDYLLAVNCSVGREDKNTWLFHLGPGAIDRLDGVNLQKDPGRAQVFAFNSQLAELDGRVYGLVTTEEGLLWTLAITREGRLAAGAPVAVGFPLGDALAYAPRRRLLAVVGMTLYLFRLEAGSPAAAWRPADPAGAVQESIDSPARRRLRGGGQLPIIKFNIELHRGAAFFLTPMVGLTAAGGA